MAMRANDELLVGCSKRSYLTRVSADREAGLHAQWAPSCDKCADGLPFVSYRCTENRAHIWHVGHDSLEGTMMAAADTSAPLRGGDTWVAVSARGKGQPVKILTVNPVNVYFRAYGRGADESQKFKLSHDAFRTRYAPLQLADDRQKRLAREERTPDLAARIEAEPVAVVPEPEPEPQPAPVVARPAPVGRGRPRLTDDQAREIYRLRQSGIPRAEVAAAYDLPRQTIHDIELGKSYRRAIADLEGAPATRHAKIAEVAPQPQPQEEPPVEITQQPTIVTERKIDDYQEMKDRLVRATPGTRSHLATEMADALEVLVEYAGKPLPKFVRLDFDAIRALIEQARAS